MNNLFGGLGGMGAPAATKPLVEFRAGKMNIGDNKLVTPDRTKGLVQLVQSADSLMHFIWKDRTTGSVVDDLIIFPEEATFKTVKQSNGRVFLLEFKDSSRKIFFWMQEPKADKDEEYVTKINQFINNPPNPELGFNASSPSPSIQTRQVPQQTQTTVPQAQAPIQQTPQTVPSTDDIEMPSLEEEEEEEDNEDEEEDELEMALQMSMQQAATAVPPTTSAHTSSVPSSTQQGLSVNFLQNILGGMQDFRQQRRNTLGYYVGHHLPRVLNSENLVPLLNSPDIVQRLLPYLPEENRTPEELRAVVTSPQFQQALQSFGYALETGQLNDVLQQIGLDQNAEAVLRQSEKEVKDKDKQ